MKKTYLILFVIAVLVLSGVLFLMLNNNETAETAETSTESDSIMSIEDNFGNLTWQQQAVIAAKRLYLKKKQQGMRFESQCLGIVISEIERLYVVDIVHVPRNAEDNKQENQCQEYINGEVSHFIELDKDGNIVRIA